MNVYRVVVTFHGNPNNPNWIHIKKTITRCEIVRTGNKYFYLRSLPEPYHDEEIKVPTEDCFSDLKSAHKEADKRASVLVAKLRDYIIKLEQPAEVIDKLTSDQEQ